MSGEDPDQYKRYVRGQIKQLTEQENDPLVGDWIVVYVWHSGIDPNSKGARKVYSRSLLLHVSHKPLWVPTIRSASQCSA